MPVPAYLPVQDKTSQLLWWLALVCDPGAWEPGPREAAGQPPQLWWPRDRSARVDWKALEVLLREIVEAGGSRERYLQEWWRVGGHQVSMGAGSNVTIGGRCSAAP